MNTPPPEVQEMIKNFRDTDPGWQRECKAKGKPEIKLKHGAKPREAEVLAGAYKLEVEFGHGRHGKHIVCPKHLKEGGAPLPDHGAGQTLSPGVIENILNFIRRHQNCKP